MMATNCPQQYKYFYIKWSASNSHLLTDVILFLGASAKLWKATINFVICDRREQLGFHWIAFHEILYLSTFRQCEENIPVSLKSDENKGQFIWRSMYISDHILVIPS